MSKIKAILITFGFFVCWSLAWTVGLVYILLVALELIDYLNNIFPGAIVDLEIFVWAEVLFLISTILGGYILFTLLGFRFIARRWPQLSWSKSRTLKAVAVILPILLWAALVFLIQLSIVPSRGSSDIRRIGNMRQFQLALEGYYDDHNAYPVGDGSATTCSTTAAELADLVPTYITALPINPSGSSIEYAYDAPTASGGQEYILRAQLQDTNHSALDSDIDGTVYGCDCSDKKGYFCVKP